MKKNIQDLHQELYDHAARTYVYAVKHNLSTDMWEAVMLDFDKLMADLGEK